MIQFNGGITTVLMKLQARIMFQFIYSRIHFSFSCFTQDNVCVEVLIFKKKIGLKFASLKLKQQFSYAQMLFMQLY